jgi:hypothetical protein
MTTSLFDRVPVDEIRDEAHQVQVGRLLLTLIVGVFWLIGWLAGKASLGVGYCWAAVKIGWKEAHGVQLRGPRARTP